MYQRLFFVFLCICLFNPALYTSTLAQQKVQKKLTTKVQLNKQDSLFYNSLDSSQRATMSELILKIAKGKGKLDEKSINFWNSFSIENRTILDRWLIKKVADSVVYRFEPLLKIEDEAFIKMQEGQVKEKLLKWLELSALDPFKLANDTIYAFYLAQKPEVQRKMIRMASANLTESPLVLLDLIYFEDEKNFFKLLPKDEQERLTRIHKEIAGKGGYKGVSERLRNADEDFYYGIDEFKKFWINTFIAGKVLDLGTETLVFKDETKTKKKTKTNSEPTTPTPTPKTTPLDLSKVKVDKKEVIDDKKEIKTQKDTTSIQKTVFYWAGKNFKLEMIPLSSKGLIRTFPLDKYADYGADSLTIIEELLKVMNKSPKVKLLVEVHTDDLLTQDDALPYTYETAKEIKNFLVEKKIPANRIVVIGWGGARPALPNSSDAAQELNRRIEFRYVIGK